MDSLRGEGGMEERDPTRELCGSQHQEPAKETEGEALGWAEESELGCPLRQ